MAVNLTILNKLNRDDLHKTNLFVGFEIRIYSKKSKNIDPTKKKANCRNFQSITETNTNKKSNIT
jgi:hypothetical protein